MLDLTPKAIASQLDRYIVGQTAAKRAVAIALRNRWRRMQLEPELRAEVMPKNILMIGPTGVGKTEIARRLASMAGAPFVKVEATKFTEVGYVGKDVETIIRDLVEASVKMTRDVEIGKVRSKAHARAVDRILDIWIPPRRGVSFEHDPQAGVDTDNESRRKTRAKLLAGELDESMIDIELAQNAAQVDIMGPPGMEEMTQQLRGMFAQMGGGKTQKRNLSIKAALPLLIEEESSKLINEEEIKQQALTHAQQNGIVFIDEIDKVCQRSDWGGAGVSREGVQRDLLPLVEGSVVSTKYGPVKTDHMLFIASGAFHLAKPSDLIPELQGRFPIRVELTALSAQDFERILTEPQNALSKQYSALLATEGVRVQFTEDGIRRLAEVAFTVNAKTENIGARRLHTVMEKLLESISFDADERAGSALEVNAAFVSNQLGSLAADEDLSRYIL